MAVKYMITASQLVDLAEERITQSLAVTQKQNKLPAAPQKSRSPISFKGFMLCAIVITGAAIWFATNQPVAGNLKIFDFITGSKLNVTGIVCHEEGNIAHVGGKVVREGDTISGYKVIKITAERVEFEKNGRITARKPGK